MNTGTQHGRTCVIPQASYALLSVARIVVLAACAGSFVLASPAKAEPADSSEPQQNMMSKEATQPQPEKSPNAAKRHLTPQERARHTEERIKTLHGKLGITKDQEAKWAEVAKTMRDNEATIASLIEARHKNASTMTALDDLQSYEDITQAHADGIKKMIASFEPLYDEMSDEQKKNADKVFSSYEGHGGKPAHKSK